MKKEIRGCVAGLVNRLRTGEPRDRSSFPGRDKKFVCASKYPDLELLEHTQRAIQRALGVLSGGGGGQSGGV
jgi:hypothetical protein